MGNHAPAGECFCLEVTCGTSTHISLARASHIGMRNFTALEKFAQPKGEWTVISIIPLLSASHAYVFYSIPLKQQRQRAGGNSLSWFHYQLKDWPLVWKILLYRLLCPCLMDHMTHPRQSWLAQVWDTWSKVTNEIPLLGIWNWAI